MTSPSPTLRVVLADDHPIIRDGLAALLTQVDGIEVVGLAADGHEAVRAAVTLQPDVLVMDLHMPRLDGVGATREVSRAAPDVGVLVLSMLEDDESTRAALEAGAAGYIVKGASREQIVRAIQTVAAGDTVLAPGPARHVLDAARGPGPRTEPFEALSPREREILDLLAAGCSTRDIADRTGLAPKTVSNTLSAVFAKIGVASRTQAALLARRAGLGEPR